jgi:hypothetical protein
MEIVNFIGGDPFNGIEGTVVTPGFLNNLQAEISEVLAAAGIAPKAHLNDQLMSALTLLYGGIRGDVQANKLNYAKDVGVTNAYKAIYTPAIASLIDGMIVVFQALNPCTGAATLAVNGIAAKPLLGAGLRPLQGGEIIAAGKCIASYHAVNDSWILVHASGGATQVGAATKSDHAVQLGQLGNIAQLNIGSGLLVIGDTVTVDLNSALARTYWMMGQ